jgi:hypothetical protein
MTVMIPIKTYKEQAKELLDAHITHAGGVLYHDGVVDCVSSVVNNDSYFADEQVAIVKEMLKLSDEDANYYEGE